MKNPRAKHNFLGRTCSITGVGSYVPERILTNADLEKMVETSDEWITTRTGIKERRIAAADEFTSDLAAKAARRAMEMAGVTAEQIDLIIVASITPDMPFPNTACLVQQKIGARRIPAFDIEAACSGFHLRAGSRPEVHHRAHLRNGAGHRRGKTFVHHQLEGPQHLRAVRRRRRRGDFAEPAASHGLLTTALGADGGKAELLSMPGGGSRCPASAQTVLDGLHFLRMDGKETFKNAVQAMCSAANEVLSRCEIDITKIKCVIPHQANRRIIDAVGDRLGATPEQLFINLHKYGNTSAASVAIALDEAVRSGRILRGDLILIVAFGRA